MRTHAEGGYSVPVGNLTTALARTLALGAEANELRSGVSFHDAENQWSLFGTLLEPEGDLVLQGLELESRGHVLLAAADGQARDIDLHLLDAEDEEVERDDADDAMPVITLDTNGQSYSLRIVNGGSDGATLVVSAFLDIAPSEEEP